MLFCLTEDFIKSHVRVVDLKKRRWKCVGRAAGVRAICLAHPLNIMLVRTTAGELGLGNSWRREERQENRFRDRQCARKIVEGNEESASSPAFLAISERQKHHRVARCSG